MTEAERYHLSQYEKPYESTEALDRFIRRVVGGTPDGVFMDVGCGAGSFIHHMGEWGMTDLCAVVGVDHDPQLLAIAGERNPGASFICLDFRGDLPRAQVTTSVQVLSFIEEWEGPLSKLIAATSDWLFVTSLFWDGVSTHTHASDREKRDAHYNIIERNAFETACRALGARQIVWEEFVPKRSFVAPLNELRSRVRAGETRSGPLLMPWWMVGIGMREAGD